MRKDDLGTIIDLTGHPYLKLVTAIGTNGVLKSWNYTTGKSIVSHKYEEGKLPTAIAYSNCLGTILAIGFENGDFNLLESTTLTDTKILLESYSSESPIRKIVFDAFNNFICYTNDAFTISIEISSQLLKLEKEKNEPTNAGYNFRGRFCAHRAPILDVLFINNPEDKKVPRLFTLGADHRLVEYNLISAVESAELEVLQAHNIDRVNCPLSLCHLPVEEYPEDFICVANDRNKLVLYNSVTMLARRTFAIAATEESCERIKVVSQSQDDSFELKGKRFLAAITKSKLTLTMLPLTGNPYEMACTTANIAPSSGSLAISPCGRFFFTAGGTDNSLHMWSVRYDLLQKRLEAGGEGMVPFNRLIPASLHEELKDYFYYAMLITQEIDILNKRITCRTIPIKEVPHIFRAIGVYLTEQE
ncbi:Cilia- and flagella-associated protein 251, partial [Cichlidogyrus casuarinus]